MQHLAKNYATAGLALLITLIASAAFFIGAILGLNYFFRGYTVATCLVGLLLVGVFAVAFALMIVGKTTHHARVGSRYEWGAMFVVAATLAVGSLCFSKFLYVYDHQERMRELVEQTVTSVSEIDSCYDLYADQRVAAVKRKSPAQAKVLDQYLRPAERDSILPLRHEWLGSLHEAKVWNLSTATNVRQLSEAARQWTEEYTILSSVILQSEADSIRPFEHIESAHLLADFQHDFTRINHPDARSLGVLLVCLIGIMMCYLTTRSPKSKSEGTH